MYIRGFFPGSETFKVCNYQVEVFWDVKPCSVAVGCQHFRGPCFLYVMLHPESGGSKVLQNSIPPQHYMALQTRRLCLEGSLKSHIHLV